MEKLVGKLIGAVGGLSILLGATAYTVSARADALRVTGPGGAAQAALVEAVINPWAKKTGTEVIVDEYDQRLAPVRAQVEAGSLKWDVVMMGPSSGPQACQEGLLVDVSAENIADQADFAKPLDPCLIPFMSSSGGLVYDGAKFGDNGPKTWADFWDVEKFPGKRGLFNQPDETLELALLADGVAPQDLTKALTAPDGVERAFRKLAELKPHVKWYATPSEGMQLLAAGDVVMVYNFNGRVSKANRDDHRDFRFVWNAGHVNGSIYYAIITGSPNMSAAVDFLRFLAQPEQQAAAAMIAPYGPLNLRAPALLDKATAEQLPSSHMDTVVDQDDPDYVAFWLDNRDALYERFAAWQAQ